MNILFILTPLLAVASSHSWDWTNLTNETRLDQRGAEGPDALQVLIKGPMVVSDHLFTSGGTGSVVLTGKIADTCSDTSLTGG